MTWTMETPMFRLSFEQLMTQLQQLRATLESQTKRTLPTLHCLQFLPQMKKPDFIPLLALMYLVLQHLLATAKM
jgi:hypothetical protein